MKRAARGAEREELLASLEELALWYRDLARRGWRAPRRRSSTPTGSRSCARTPCPSGSPAPSARPSSSRETWRAMEEFNVNPTLTLEALFIRLRRELGVAVPV